MLIDSCRWDNQQKRRRRCNRKCNIEQSNRYWFKPMGQSTKTKKTM